MLALSTLPELDINMDEIVISGISSGAFFTVQFSIAYSRLIKGAVVFAGGPYYCS